MRIIEFAGLGPAPLAAMILSDMGADVVRIDRRGKGRSKPTDITSRGRRSVELDLKTQADVATAHKLINAADVLIEGFRPGVMERMGLGPNAPGIRNRKLVYARMTGWGQEGPLSRAAGHDINYIAVTGALGSIGPADGVPVPPLNLVGDYGGGALYLVSGILAARVEALQTGLGQVVDCAMVDGVINMMTLFHSLAAEGQWDERLRGGNFLDGGAHFYRTYECADGRYISVGALEPQFYSLLREKAGLDGSEFADQNDSAKWLSQSAKAEKIFRRKSRAEWCAILEGTDACFAPVLTMTEAEEYPHIVARKSFVEVAGVRQSAPAPRFSRTPSSIQSPPPSTVLKADDILETWLETVA
ncbi:CaiB/BaiF CoA transferase family protein [Aminobacter sp. LjRoot7]|uniref:CaiB/BaiF CoA transferase family protein n=1 Tax=Aminobacter sp. LjRoot7 TaxID=3342335 RepID=UPI003F4FA7BC